MSDEAVQSLRQRRLLNSIRRASDELSADWPYQGLNARGRRESETALDRLGHASSVLTMYLDVLESKRTGGSR